MYITINNKELEIDKNNILLVALVIVQLESNNSIAENRGYHYDKEQAIIVDSIKFKTAPAYVQY